MAKSLIIVESPAKTKTLKGFLGSDFQIEASMGHVRDLPKKELGVDLEAGFAPSYVTIPEKRAVLKKLAAAAKNAETVYLASDPDREGEAIAWHVAQALKLRRPRRITFNEITRRAVREAIQHPREIDLARVDAQEARRVLDRLVGYRISPLLWRKVQKNLSAGRVQSVAVRLIVEREREIEAFVPREYWSLTATLTPQPPQERFPFDAKLVGHGKEKLELADQQQTEAVVRDLDGARYVVQSVKKREQKGRLAPPFITSTLQQEAARKLGFANRRTMSVAQQLYEGVDIGSAGSVGLITYMRTDSTRVATEAQTEAREFIARRFGPAFVPEKPNQYRSRQSAQEAHEAIRPTSIERTPESLAKFLKPEQLRLYRLIWQRFLASQMKPAVFDVTTALIDANGYTFRATGSVVKFEGARAVYTEGRDTDEQTDEERAPLPVLTEDQLLDLIKLDPKQHFTEPPPRFTEATIVRALEEQGIGRPSTYASIIATILEREYATLSEKKFRPTELGTLVNDLLVRHFPDIFDVGFTASIETRLDEIEERRASKVTLLGEFYPPFERALDLANEQMERVKPRAVETEHTCPKCGKTMLLRQSKFGPFLGCSGYPKCKQVLNEDGSERAKRSEEPAALSDQPCPKCGKALVERSGKFGKFLGCSGYPKCRTIVRLPGDTGPSPSADRNGRPAAEALGVACPKDGVEVVVKRSRKGAVFYGCANYPACDYTTWHKPLNRPCPRCGFPLGEQAFRGRPTGAIKCTRDDCDYVEPAREPATAS